MSATNPDRAETLRRQAQATAEARTAERDKLREAMPTGLALELLLAQIKRLRASPRCETMEFDPAGNVDDLRSALTRELEELDTERTSDFYSSARQRPSDAWVGEWRDVLTIVLHMGVAAGLRIDAELAAQASKLGRRIDHLDAGGTWAEAKAAERARARANAAVQGASKAGS